MGETQRANYGSWTVGRELCFEWCIKAVQITIDNFSDSNFQIEWAERTALWIPLELKIKSHGWLECCENRDRFIADGTAGQIDQQYRLGFYGFLEGASERLRVIYETQGGINTRNTLPYRAIPAFASYCVCYLEQFFLLAHETANYLLHYTAIMRTKLRVVFDELEFSFCVP